MRINKIVVRPEEKSLNPELVFEIEMNIQNKAEIPLEIRGSIFTEDGIKIANIYEIIHDFSRSYELAAEDVNSINEEKITIKLGVGALLNYKALDYIETLRDKNQKRDVVLNLDIIIKSLKSRAMLSHMFLLESKALDFQLPGEYKNAKPVFYEYFRNGINPSHINMWILSGNGGATFIEMRNIEFKEKIVIPSSDWINDYCSVFQIGRFSVFEYPLPDYLEGAERTITIRLDESINAIKKMEEDIKKGEWNQVIEDSRAVWELLRNHDEIKDILTRDGYTEEAFKELNESLNKLFDFSSKFHHKLDKDRKKIMGDIKASKEDAYLIYTVSMNMVNLILKKVNRLNGDLNASKTH